MKFDCTRKCCWSSFQILRLKYVRCLILVGWFWCTSDWYIRLKALNLSIECWWMPMWTTTMMAMRTLTFQVGSKEGPTNISDWKGWGIIGCEGEVLPTNLSFIENIEQCEVFDRNGLNLMRKEIDMIVVFGCLCERWVDDFPPNCWSKS
jgi:hypothetical protein